MMAKGWPLLFKTYWGLAEGGDSIGQRILNVVKLNVSL
jgi:hypothetical protein